MDNGDADSLAQATGVIPSGVTPVDYASNSPRESEEQQALFPRCAFYLDLDLAVIGDLVFQGRRISFTVNIRKRRFLRATPFILFVEFLHSFYHGFRVIGIGRCDG